MFRTALTAILLGLAILQANGQSTAALNDFTRGSGIPVSLKERLKVRLESFVRAQQEGKWELVWEMTGWDRASYKGTKTTPSEKKCLIDQMKANQLIAFRPTQTRFSTGILSLPLREKWWSVQGIGEFQTAAGKATKTIDIIAKRQDNDWFFLPYIDDDEWERRYISQAASSSEIVKYIDVESQPGCSVEIQNLSANIDETYLSLRDVTFEVRNKTKKTVTGVGYRILTPVGETYASVGRGVTIKPAEFATFEITMSVYKYFCQGPQRRTFLIDFVQFTDGSEWRLRKKAPGKTAR